MRPVHPAYLRLRKLVDRDMKNPRHPLIPFLLLVPLAAYAAAVPRSVPGWIAGFLGLIALTVAAEAFVGWRAARLLKALRLLSSRSYAPRTGLVPLHESAAGEDALMAIRRRNVIRRPR